MKILIEIFCQKLVVSNIISVFLDHLKPKIFFCRPTMVANIERPSFSKSLYPPLLGLFCTRLIRYNLLTGLLIKDFVLQTLTTASRILPSIPLITSSTIPTFQGDRGILSSCTMTMSFTFTVC